MTIAAARLGFVTPDLFELTPNVSQTGVVTLTIKAKGGQSVKYAVSTSSEPAPATVRAASPQLLDNDGVYRSGTVATLTAGQTLFIAAFAYEHSDGSGSESKLLPAKITHYEGGVALDLVEKSRTAYQITYRATARDADGDQVRIAYRTQLVSGGPSEDYASPTPSYDPTSNYGTQPRGVDIVLDRTFGSGTDRWLECWAEDANGNKGSIARALIPAVDSTDAENGVTGLTVTPSFVACAGGQPGLHNSVNWTKNAPSSWTVDLWSCFGGGCSLPGSLVQGNATPAFDHWVVTAVKAGVTSTDSRKYRIILKNSYGDSVDTDDTSNIATQYTSCP